MVVFSKLNWYLSIGVSCLLRYSRQNQNRQNIKPCTFMNASEDSLMLITKKITQHSRVCSIIMYVTWWTIYFSFVNQWINKFTKWYFNIRILDKDIKHFLPGFLFFKRGDKNNCLRIILIHQLNIALSDIKQSPLMYIFSSSKE